VKTTTSEKSDLLTEDLSMESAMETAATLRALSHLVRELMQTNGRVLEEMAVAFGLVGPAALPSPSPLVGKFAATVAAAAAAAAGSSAANRLVLFARNRQRLTEAERRLGDEMLLQAEKRTVMCMWAVAVLEHLFSGDADAASALAAKGPREVAMCDSIYVAYARLRRHGSMATGLIADCSFLVLQSMTESAAAVVEVLARGLAGLSSEEAWPTHRRGVA
jgi:hypothetical protein